jgi:WD40 repeat protein
VSEPEAQSGASEGAHLEARAEGNARVYQAVRDQHFYFRDGVRAIRRVAPAWGEDLCPYPGLASFGQEQAAFFFGRDRLTADLVGRLGESLIEGGPLMVVAPSGAGKSSLLRAGMLAAVKCGALPVAGSRSWPHLVFTPTAHPMRAAAAQIEAIAATSDSATEPVGGSTADLAELLRIKLHASSAAGGVSPARAVIVVDQLEELFSLCLDGGERRAFVDWLEQVSRGASGGNAPALVICGLRADFYAECANYPQLRAALQADQVVVGPMTQEELREAIIYPAEAVGLDIEAGLVELLLRDLGIAPDDGGAQGAAGDYAAGRLPLLAHALQATWQQLRGGSTLTVDGYRVTGGIHHAISTSAERVFGRLDPAGQHVAAAFFLRLVKISEAGEDVRRRVSREDLLRGSRHSDVVLTVLHAFTRSRLLTQTRDTVEITHEALIRAWPRLRQWIEEDRAGHLVRQELEEAAAAWNRDRRDKDALWRGGRLDVARRRAASPHQGDLSQAATEFLSASNQHERRAGRRRRAAVAALTTLALLASGAAAFAFQQQATAQAARDNAIIGGITTEAEGLPGSDVSLAAQLDAVAYRMRPSQDTYTNLLTMADSPLSTPLTGATGPVKSVAFSPRGHVLATGSGDGAIRLWNVTDPGRPARLTPAFRPGADSGTGDSGITSMAFSPDGQELASSSVSGVLTLWNVSDPGHPVPTELRLPGPLREVDSVAFSPDGRILAAGSADGTIQLWDVAGAAHPLGSPLQGPGGVIASLAISPDGRILVAGSGAASSTGGIIQLWNVSDPARPVSSGASVQAGAYLITSVAFSPDGDTLASAGADQTVRLWHIAGGGLITPIGPPVGTTNAIQFSSVAFSPDGRTVASSSRNSIQLWTATRQGLILLGVPLTGHTGPVESLAFSPDGQSLASGSEDYTARLWKLPPDVLTDTAAQVVSTVFSPNGHILAAGNSSRTIQLWNLNDPALPSLLGPAFKLRTTTSGAVQGITSVAFSPGGRILAAATYDGAIQLWDIADPAHPSPLGKVLSLVHDGSHVYGTTQVAFSPDGRVLAVGGGNGIIDLLNVADPAAPTRIGQHFQGSSAQVDSLAFSPNGRILGTGTIDGAIRLWNIANPAAPVLLGHFQNPAFSASPVLSVAFSPDGRTLATGSSDSLIRLWNVANPTHVKLLGQPLTGITGEVYSVAFSPDGRTLASGSGDATVRLWNVADPAHPAALGQPLTGSQGLILSVAFSPNGQFLASGGVDGVVRLWPTNANQAIRWICTAIPGILTPQLWQHYIPDLPFNPPCAPADSGNR